MGRSTKESLSLLTDREAEDAVAQPLMKKTLSAADADDGLKSVFRATDQEISSTKENTTCNMPPNLETALLTLMEAFKCNRAKLHRITNKKKKEKTLSSADADGLKFAFRATDQISRATSDDNQSSTPQNLEIALLALTEALKRK